MNSTEETLEETVVNAGFKNVPTDLIQKLKEDVYGFKTTSDFFESKPQRAVLFDEFAGAVIPQHSFYDNLVGNLTQKGLVVESYDQVASKTARFDAINSLRRRLNDQGMETLFTPAGFGLGAGAAMYGQTKER